MNPHYPVRYMKHQEAFGSLANVIPRLPRYYVPSEVLPALVNFPRRAGRYMQGAAGHPKNAMLRLG